MERLRQLKGKALYFVVLSLAFLLLTVILLSALKINPFTPSPYNTYTRQAMAWREGRAYLSEDVPHLELAIYQDRYYVSFPPVPSLPIFLLTFVFGDQVPDGLLVLLYASLTLLMAFRLLINKGFSPVSSALYAFFFLFASSYLPLMLHGAVWYQAQVLAMAFTVAAIYFLDKDKPTQALLFYALAVGCRPFNALYGPLLILLYLLRFKETGAITKQLKKLIPGILLGLLVAAVYAFYNWIRFGNPLEFGHNHLPEFSFQGGTQFSFKHVLQNMRTFLFSLPFEQGAQGWQMKIFGFSLLIANPALTLMLSSFLIDGIRRRLTIKRVAIIAFFLLHLLLLLMHRTFGGFQYGARYAVDLLPYALLYLTADKPKSISKIEAAVLLLGLALAIYGSLNIHL